MQYVDFRNDVLLCSGVQVLHGWTEFVVKKEWSCPNDSITNRVVYEPPRLDGLGEVTQLILAQEPEIRNQWNV